MEYLNIKAYFKNEDIDDFGKVVSLSDESVNAVINSLKEKFNLSIEFKDISFDQMVKIEGVLSSESEPYDKIAKILMLYFRPINEKSFVDDKNINDIYESVYKELIAGATLFLFDLFMKSRHDFFYKRFKGVVYTGSNEKKDEEPVPETFEVKFYKIFGWYERQKILSKELNISMREVLSITAEEALVELTYQMYRNKLDEFREKTRKKQ